jgi:hypothetical protein
LPENPSALAVNRFWAPTPLAVVLNEHWANELNEAATNAAAKIEEVKILLMTVKV